MVHEPIKETEYLGFTIKVWQDYSAPDPSKEFDYYSKDEVKAWENGEVYGYTVHKPNGEEIESCWGYYTDAALKESSWMHADATSAVDYYCGQQLKKRLARLKQLIRAKVGLHIRPSLLATT